MVFIGNFNKLSYSVTISTAKSSKIVIFAFTYVSKSLALLYGNFGLNSDSIDGDEAMKHEAMKFEAMKHETMQH